MSLFVHLTNSWNTVKCLFFLKKGWVIVRWKVSIPLLKLGWYILSIHLHLNFNDLCDGSVLNSTFPEVGEASGAQDTHKFHLHVIRVCVTCISKFLISWRRTTGTNIYIYSSISYYGILQSFSATVMNKVQTASPVHLYLLFPYRQAPPLLHPDLSRERQMWILRSLTLTCWRSVVNRKHVVVIQKKVCYEILFFFLKIEVIGWSFHLLESLPAENTNQTARIEWVWKLNTI